jgi:hypothetical protein
MRCCEAGDLLFVDVAKKTDPFDRNTTRSFRKKLRCGRRDDSSRIHSSVKDVFRRLKTKGRSRGSGPFLPLSLCYLLKSVLGWLTAINSPAST